MKLKIAFLLSLATCVTALPAATYNGAGTYTIGAGGDYSTLAAFSADFNALGTGMTGATTLSITSDITETTSVLMSAPTNGFKLLIKPAASVSPTVTFSNPVSNGTGSTIWEGHLVFGPATFTETVNYRNMPNIEIDGSNSTSTTRDLRFVNTSPGATETVNRCMIRFVGDTDNALVRNLVVDSVTTGSGDNLGIDFMARRGTDNVNHLPDNCEVRNCLVRVNRGGVGVGVRFTTSATPAIPAGTAINGAIVRDCEIYGSARAILFNFNAGGLIENNIARGQQLDIPAALTTTQTLTRLEIIRHQTSNGTSGWVMDILRNKIDSAQTWDSRGVNMGIGVGGGTATAVVGGTTNVFNNIIAGYSMSAPSTQPASQWLSRGIGIENAGTNVYNIYHNSINMANLSSFATADTSHRLGALTFNSTNFTGTVNFKNNIVRQGQNNGAVIATLGSVVVTTATASLNFDHNTYFPSANGEFAYVSGVSYPTLASWQTRVGSPDASSVIADPLVGTGGGTWVSATDLHFTADPGAAFQSVSPAGVSNDIDGNTRPSGPLEKGADEIAGVNGFTSAQDWQLLH